MFRFYGDGVPSQEWIRDFARSTACAEAHIVNEKAAIARFRADRKGTVLTTTRCLQDAKSWEVSLATDAYVKEIREKAWSRRSMIKFPLEPEELAPWLRCALPALTSDQKERMDDPPVRERQLPRTSSGEAGRGRSTPQEILKYAEAMTYLTAWRYNATVAEVRAPDDIVHWLKPEELYSESQLEDRKTYVSNASSTMKIKWLSQHLQVLVVLLAGVADEEPQDLIDELEELTLAVEKRGSEKHRVCPEPNLQLLQDDAARMCIKMLKSSNTSGSCTKK